MSETLSQILKSGFLVDNSIHRVKDRTFERARPRTQIPLHVGRGANSLKGPWALLQKAHDLQINRNDLQTLRPETEYTHNTEDRLIELNGFGPEDFTICTGNVVGSISADGHLLRISSRFGDDFLRFIVTNAEGFVEEPDSGGQSNEGGYEWLLIHIWRTKLKRALRLGLPKSYENKNESLVQVRGRLDPVDYTLNHRKARYSCTYREHSYNNPVTRLIARTLDHLDHRQMLSGDHSLRHAFLHATEGKLAPLQELLATKPLRNPYFSDYTVVIDLAKRILRNDLLDSGEENDASAFFFDVSMLFEQFVRNLLRRCGCRMREPNGSAWTISSGTPEDRRRLIPDLLFEFNERTFVFDVKYKRFQFSGPGAGVKREDLFQLHTYLGLASSLHEIAGCGIIYPIDERDWEKRGLDEHGGIYKDTITQGGQEYPFIVVFIKIPSSEKYKQPTNPQPFPVRFNENLRVCRHWLQKSLTNAVATKVLTRKLKTA